MQVVLPEPQDLEVVQTFTENPTVGGTFTNVFSNNAKAALTLGGEDLVDDMEDFDAVTDIELLWRHCQETVRRHTFTNTLDRGNRL